MGYSFGCRAKNQKLRQKMHAFMLANYRRWGDVEGDPDRDSYTRYPEDPDDLSYDDDPRVLGFDFNASCWEREYIFTVCRWMAIRVGAQTGRFPKGILRDERCKSFMQARGPVPYVTYDGEENWPLFVGTSADARKVPSALRWCAVDVYGLKNGPEWFEFYGDASVCDPVTATGRKAFEKAAIKLGKCPEDSPGAQWERSPRRKWLQEYRRLMVRSHMPSIRVKVKLMRDELKRLDAIWQAL